MKATWEATKREPKRLQLEQSLATLSTQQDALSQDQQRCHEAMTAMTLSLHPFTLETQEPQTFSDIDTALQNSLKAATALGTLLWRSEQLKPLTLLKTATRHAQGLHAW